MSLKSQENQERQTTGAGSVNLLTTNKRKRRYQIAAAILTVFVLHLAWQFSFVQRENLRVAEDSLDDARLAVAPTSNQPSEPSSEKMVEAQPALTAKKSVEENAKTVVPVKYSPFANKSNASDAKNKPAREPRSARLRRAEKLLTGF